MYGRVHLPRVYRGGPYGRHIGRVYTHQGVSQARKEGIIPTRVPPRQGKRGNNTHQGAS